jgi:DNA polymerase-3 subunit epsilon
MLATPESVVAQLTPASLLKVASSLGFQRENMRAKPCSESVRAFVQGVARADTPHFLAALPLASVKALCRAHSFSETGEKSALASALSWARPWEVPRRFAALDFETANSHRESACAVALVVVEDGKIVDTFASLIKPPRGRFEFTFIHGITAQDVAHAPSYAEVHHEILGRLEGAAFLAAHNASFDASVMRGLCEWYGVSSALPPWRCTVKLARATWRLSPARLPDVCRHLGLSLRHHDATSDATACAQIVVAALQATMGSRTAPGAVGASAIPLASKEWLG